MIFARRAHKAAKGEPLNFKFAIASVSDEDKLDQDKVAVLKVSRGEEGPVFSKTDFKIELKTLNEKEIDEYYEAMKSKIEEKKKEMKDDEKDSEKESRRPKFKQAIVGEVNVKEVDCDDFSKYMIVYGDASALKEAKKGGSRPSLSGFIIWVEGCDEEPKPVPDNDDDDEEKPEPKQKRAVGDKVKDKEGNRKPKKDDKDGDRKPRPDDKDGCRKRKPDNKDGERRPKPDEKDGKRQPRSVKGGRKNKEGDRRPKPDDKDGDRKPRPDDKDGCRKPKPDNGDKKKDRKSAN